MCLGGELQKDSNAFWEHKRCFFFFSFCLKIVLVIIYPIYVRWEYCPFPTPFCQFSSHKNWGGRDPCIVWCICLLYKTFTGYLEIRFVGLVVFFWVLFCWFDSFHFIYATLSNLGKSHLSDFCRQHINPGFINSKNSPWMHPGTFFCSEVQRFWIGKKSKWVIFHKKT